MYFFQTITSLFRLLLIILIGIILWPIYFIGSLNRLLPVEFFISQYCGNVDTIIRGNGDLWITIVFMICASIYLLKMKKFKIKYAFFAYILIGIVFAVAYFILSFFGYKETFCI